MSARVSSKQKSIRVPVVVQGFYNEPIGLNGVMIEEAFPPRGFEVAGSSGWVWRRMLDRRHGDASEIR